MTPEVRHQGRAATVTAPEALLRAQHERDAFPLYPFPRMLCFIELVAPTQANLLTVVDLDSPVDDQLVRRVCEDLLRLHSALRYGFARRSGHFWQQDRGVEHAVAGLDLLPAAAPEAQRDARFSFADGPFLRASVSEDGRQVVLHTNHLVSDRWSLWLLRRDFAALLAARRGEHPAPQAPPRSYGELVLADHLRYVKGEFDDELAFWRWYLRDSTGLPAAGASPDASAPSRGVQLRLTSEDIAAIDRLAAATAATPFCAFSAIVARALGQSLGADDVPLMAISANRRLRSSWDVVGCFSDAVPMRFPASADLAVAIASGSDALRRPGLPSDWVMSNIDESAREALRAGGDHLVVYLRSDGSPADIARSGGRDRRVVEPCNPAGTWGLTLDAMVDVNIDTESTVRVTFRPDRISEAAVAAMLAGIEAELDRQ